MDEQFANANKADYAMPEYNPKQHYLDITKYNYYKAVIVLRDSVKRASDFYWSSVQGGYNVDLFVMSPTVSSPMGPGSDSEAVEIQFGNLKTFLTDSAQFGFEPILMGGIDKAFVFSASIRGEDSDKRHTSQFTHCEAEIIGTLDDLIPQVEGYTKFLAATILNMKNIIRLMSLDPEMTITRLNEIVSTEKYTQVEFDDACKLLTDAGYSEFVKVNEKGRDISSKGELVLAELLKTKLPIWLRNYDRDRVAFYQKPHPNNPDKVINTDLIFPNIIPSSFGGELLGSGQRQNNAEEMLESLQRQGVDPFPYEWYIDLRRQSNYRTTAGFGMGVERFMTWSMCHDDIKDFMLYPRLKNVVSYP
jgi:asparaginyl-tRNA synthetase